MERFYFNLVRFMALSCALWLPVHAQLRSAPPESQERHRIEPPSPTASADDLESQGDELRLRKEYLDAIDYYRVAMAKEDNSAVHNKIGISLLQLKRYGDAKKEFQRSVKMDGKDAVAHNNLGAVCYQMREFGQSIKEYKKAINLNEENASFHSNLGTAYFSHKDFKRALKEYDRALALDPTIFEHQTAGGVSAKLITSDDLAHFHYVIAKMYGRQGDLQRVRLYLSKANEEGYPNVKDALKDEEFTALRKDPKFVAFVRSLKPPSPENN